MEPSIRLTNDLSLKMKIEVIRIGDKVLLQASPPIEQFRFGNRSAETTLSMKDGETIVLAGLIQEEDRKVRVSVPWLGDIPVVGDWFSAFQTQRVTTEVILTITPHILQNRHAPRPETQVFWSGTDGQYATKPLFSLPIRKTSLSSSGMGGSRLRSPAAESGAKPGDSAVARAGVGFGGVGEPSLELMPADLATRVGQEFRVILSAAQARNGVEGPFALHYDPAVLELRGVTEGAALRKQGGSLARKEAAGSEAGTVEFQVTQPTHARWDRGEVLVATFAAKAPGVSEVTMSGLAGTEGVPEGSTPRGVTVVRVR